MGEVGDEGADGVYYLSLGEVVVCEEGFEGLEEGVNLGQGVTGGLLYYSKALEALEVDFLARDIELLVGFLAGGVGLEIDYGIGGAVVIHGSGILTGLAVALTLPFSEAFGTDELVADGGEGEHLVLAEFGEEDFARAAEDTGEHAYLP